LRIWQAVEPLSAVPITSIQQWLKGATQHLDTSPSKRLDAEILLCHALGCERSYLYAHPRETLEPPQQDVANTLLEERAMGVPIAYLTGQREFHALCLKVSPATLIPRPETELVIDLALAFHPPPQARIADLGTGSGAIALAIAHARPDLRLVATDRSRAALEIAADNQRRLRIANVQWLCGFWLDALAGPTFQMIVGNPPYVADSDPHLDRGDCRFEPRMALQSGVQGLDDLRTIIRQARDHLLPGGQLLLEHGYDQSDAVTTLLQENGYHNVRSHPDLSGQPRVAAACWRSGHAR